MVEPAVLVAAIAVGAAVALALTAGYSHWTVPAIGPWAVAGGAVLVAARAGAYETMRTPVSGTLMLSALAALATTTWVVVSLLGASRGVQYRERYLAAAGSGVALPMVTALLFHVGVPAAALLWVLAVPLVAALISVVGFLAVGFIVADLFIDLRAAGLYTVGTVVFEAVAAVAARQGLDAPTDTLLVDTLRSGLATAGIDPVWWVVLGCQLAVGIVVVLVAGRLARVRTAIGHATVLVVSTLTLWSGTVALLSAAALG